MQSFKEDFKLERFLEALLFLSWVTDGCEGMGCPGFVNSTRSLLLLLRGSLSLSLIALALNMQVSQYQKSWGDDFQGLCDFNIKVDKEQFTYIIAVYWTVE